MLFFFGAERRLVVGVESITLLHLFLVKRDYFFNFLSYLLSPHGSVPIYLLHSYFLFCFKLFPSPSRF